MDQHETKKKIFFSTVTNVWKIFKNVEKFRLWLQVFGNCIIFEDKLFSFGFQNDLNFLDHTTARWLLEDC
jgi:hypothetical protein